ncbi:hypothetical protein [Deinococcus radiotolerans]|uniref:Pilin A4 domain-containing protein n=1 Tax=Deinococcus radiotolerans TaxID=1309407 RepID=A0ABQ2FLR4_9DEIO|nr:hypothetical protein [Deinococcus radiotolerans]GGL06494.1 hypothetical protein GCM10010844_26600 [Deinococcus radiotolerans]
MRLPLLLILALPAALASCSGMFEKHNADRAEQLKIDNALYFRTQCIQALERARATATPQQLPAKLNGQPCTSDVLGDYALSADMARTITSSVVTLDPERLSDYTITVTSLNGKTFRYVDRGDAEAAAEQAGTYTESAPDVVSADTDSSTVNVEQQTP